MKVHSSRVRTLLGASLVAILGSPLSAAVEGATVSDQESRKKARVEVGAEGIKVTSADGDFELELGGRLQVDAADHYEDSSRLGGGVETRRARLHLKGKIHRRWRYKMQFELSDGDVEIRDMYTRYTTRSKTAFTLGNFKEPFSLEDQSSSEDITFLERALPVAAFGPARALGVGVKRAGGAGSVALGLFGEPISGSNRGGDQGFGVAGRATWAPLDSKGKLLHLGAAAEYREPRADQKIRLDTRPESSITAKKLVRTRGLEDVDSTDRYGLELALGSRSVTVQSEYIVTGIERSGFARAELSGWYAYLSWFPTGETRPYDAGKGTFGRPEPRGSRGAWELAVRLSRIDLDDRDIEGGREENLTVALNWYPNTNVRLMANYILVDSVRRGETDDPGILLVRAQLAF